MGLVVASAALVVLLLGVAAVSSGRRLNLRRTVLLHTPAHSAWEGIRCLPTLLARHGRIRDRGTIEDCLPLRGDADAPGAIWRARGTWGRRAYWAEIEVVRLEPGREVGVRLVRDSLGTHRGLGGHAGILTLEETGPGASKLTWRLRAELRSPRLRVARLVGSDRLAARLLDLGLRSVKVSLEQTAREAAEPSSPAPAGASGRADATSSDPRPGGGSAPGPMLDRPGGRPELSG